MKKKIITAGILILVLIGILAVWKFINSSLSEPSSVITESQEKIKDCGSDVSKRGENSNNINRDCFLEAYKTCSSAKMYQEVYPPGDKVIKTTILIDGRENDKCRIRVQVEDKFAYPENDIYYCYSAEKTASDELHIERNLQINNCENHKPLTI